MPNIKRRHFLQFASSVLATIGLSQIDLQRQALRYAKVLAQNTERKLALLVGINGYRNYPLSGCINDVYLQRELLIHRFGFNPKDILLVTDEDKSEISPTRAGILQAFEEHLIKQAKPGDVVVYHFSGHGAQVVDPESGFADQRNSTFVPLDSSFEQIRGQLQVSDIMGATLFLLMSALKTENVTVVLDSCHSGGGKRGNLIIRSLERFYTGKTIYPSGQERSYQQEWLSRLNMSREDFIRKRQKVAKGVVIAATRRDQLAADLPFYNFYAGAFTYALTQYLWQETQNRGVGNVMANVARITTRISTTQQIPEFEAKQESDRAKPSYFLSKQVPPAEGVIQKVNGERVEFWLAGIEPEDFEVFARGKGAIFTILARNGQKLGAMQLESLKGLEGFGKIIAVEPSQSIRSGSLLQEEIRAIPKDFSLRLGLDDSLGYQTDRIRTRLRSLQQLETLPLARGEVDYILGRMTESIYREIAATNREPIPKVGSLGLYSQGRDLIPGSFGVPGENLTRAIARLQPKFRSLLAARLIKLTLNADTSKLAVSASMKILGAQEEVVASKFTPRALRNIDREEGDRPTPEVSPVRIKTEAGIPLLPLRTRVQFQVKNSEDRDLYVTVLVIDAGGEIAIVFPNTWTATTEAALIRAGETKSIPEVGIDPFRLVVSEPLGMVEVLILASISPLRSALKTLQSFAARRGLSRRPFGLDDREQTTLVNNLVGDLDRVSRTGTRRTRLQAEFDPTVRAIDTTQIAAMSITFRSIEEVL